jgi:hypothetical protein
MPTMEWVRPHPPAGTLTQRETLRLAPTVAATVCHMPLLRQWALRALGLDRQ